MDIAFPRARVAVDVRGCYWHGCPLHASVPEANASIWRAKFAGVRRRDADTEAQLVAAGWRVQVVWEHDELSRVAALIEALVGNRT